MIISRLSRRPMLSALILSVLFAGFTMIGCYCSQKILGYAVPVIGERRFVGYMLVFIPVLLLSYLLLSKLFKGMDRFAGGKDNWFSKLLSKNGFSFGRCNSVCVYLAIIALLWLPFMIFFFPGNVYSDAYWQLVDFYSPDVTSQHPFFSTLIIATLYNAGDLISDNAGVFLVVFAEAIFLLIVFACMIKSMERLEASRAACLATAVFFGFVPLFATFATTAWKDSFYAALFVLFVMQAIQLFQGYKQRIPVSKLLVYLLLGLLLCCFRKEGLYVFLATSVGFLFIVPKLQKAFFGGVTVVFLLLYTVMGATGLTSSGVGKGQVSEEMLSIPMQMTARYVAYYPEEVTEHEWDVINKVFVTKAETPLPERYDPWTADPVKGHNTNISTETFWEYVQIWIDMGLKHPKTYFGGFVNSTYGFYSPLSWEDPYGTGPYEIVTSQHPSGKYLEFADVVDFSPSYAFSDEGRKPMVDYAESWRKMPVFNQLVTPGAYVWCLLILLAALLRKRKFAAAVVFLPIIVTYGICILGPVNGFIRYFVPVMACMPLLTVFTLTCLRNIPGKQEERHNLGSGI